MNTPSTALHHLNTNVPASSSVAPDSPRESQSPVPGGPQGDVELELLGLANALYNLGTTVINDSTKEKPKPGQGGQGIMGDGSIGIGVKPVGQRVNDVVDHLRRIEEMSEHVRTMIPMQVIQDVDNGRNPMQLTKDRIERAATENQFMNGKIHAIESYRHLLNAALEEHFPELVPHLDDRSENHIDHSTATMGPEGKIEQP